MKNILFPKSLIKRLIFTVMISASYLLQFIVLPSADITLTVSFLIPTGVAIALSDKEIPSLLYGALIGALWDLASPVTDGSFSLIFAFIMCVASLLARYVLRNTLLTAVLFTLSLTVITAAANILYFRSGMTGELLHGIITSSLIPCLIINSLIGVPSYYFCRFISKHFYSEQNLLR